MTATDATFCQAVVPPPTAGMDGAVLSSLTVLPAPAVAGIQLEETLPALSVARIWTSVVPSAVIVAGAASGFDQLVPPSVEVRYWYGPISDPPVSLAPVAVRVVEPVFQLVDPPVTLVALLGAVRSIMTVPAAGADPGHAEALPSASVAWNST